MAVCGAAVLHTVIGVTLFMIQSFETLSAENLSKLATSKDYVADAKSYSTEEYLEALTQIQLYTYRDPRIVWGSRWRQKLASSIPFIVKLLYKGYNNFLVFPISTRKLNWIVYSDNEEEKYLKSAGLSLSVTQGVAYRKNNRAIVNLPTFYTESNPVADTNTNVIQRHIKYLIEVGALARVSNGFIDTTSHFQYAAKYIVSKDKLRELINLSISSFLSKYTLSSISYTSLSSSNTHTYISLSSYGDAKGAKYQNCIQNHTVENMMKWNNARLPEEEQMTYNGRRIYAEVCSYVNEEKHKDIPAGTITKQQYCDKVFGQNNWFEFDRKGSIYNLTYSLNNKDYLDNSIDIYEKMNNIKFASKEERDLYKITQMSVYFSTYRRLINFIYRYMQIKYENGVIPESKQKLIDAYWKLITKGKAMEWSDFANALKDHFEARKKAMKKFIGDNKKYIDKGSKYSESYIENTDSFIFMHESEVYLQFVTKLRERGLRVVQIYDGFYLEKGTISEVELNNILRDTVIEYCNK